MNRRKKMPVVSVIIPTYNRGWAIRDAVDSVLDQDFSNYELIVIDDGSTDNTIPILDTYRDRIVVLYQENKGVSAARNRGIAAASGQFIAFLDSDDIWLQKKLARQIDFFKSNPDALICQTGEIWIRNGVRVNPKHHHKKLSGRIFEPSLSLCLVTPSAVMMKRGLFETVGLFDEELPVCEDYDLWLRISRWCPIYLVDIPLVKKRGGHSDQLSRKWGLDKYRIESLTKIIKSNLLSTDQQRTATSVLKEKCSIYAGGCLKRGREDEAIHYLSIMEVYRPGLSTAVHK